jgi:hypothetical protein
MWRVVGLGAVGLGLMGLVAAGARGLPSRALDRGDAVIDLTSPVVGRIVMGVFAVLAVTVLVIAFWPGERASLPPRPKVSIVRMVIAMLFFAAILSVFRIAFPVTDDGATATDETAETDEAGPARWGIMLLAGALGATLFALIALGGRSARDRPAFVDAREPDDPDFERATVAAPLAGPVVTSEDEHRRRVISLYASMLADLERRGLGRRPHEAPGEYVARIAAEPGVGDAAVRRLTELFGLAGFSIHPITAATVAEAGAAASRARHEAAP